MGTLHISLERRILYGNLEKQDRQSAGKADVNDAMLHYAEMETIQGYIKI